MDFVPGSLEDTDKYIEVADGHHVTAKQKGQVRIKMCNDNEKPFIATLHNVLLDDPKIGGDNVIEYDAKRLPGTFFMQTLMHKP